MLDVSNGCVLYMCSHSHISSSVSLCAKPFSVSGVSGERIWVELKKILIGNHAASLVQVMLERGMAQVIGESNTL